MTNYCIEVEYTSNSNKAGKLELKNEEGNTLLKTDVVLPPEMHEENGFSLDTLSAKKYLPEQYSNENKYANENRITRIKYWLGDSYINLNEDVPVIASMNQFDGIYGNSASGYLDAITVSPEALKTLEDILTNPENKVEFKANKKIFIFGQKPCGRMTDISPKELIHIGVQISIEEESLKKKQDLKTTSDTKNDEFSSKFQNFKFKNVFRDKEENNNINKNKPK